MGMDGFADVDGIATHFDREADLADQLSGMGADDAAAENAMVGFVEQELGETLVAAIGNGAAGSSPGKNRLAVLDSLRLALVLGETAILQSFPVWRACVVPFSRKRRPGCFAQLL